MLQDASKSLRQDADTNGTVCRHNNKAYADGTTASNFNYPNVKYNTPVTAGTGANACTATPRFKSVARHYWKTNVEWCDKAQGLNGDKWHGYGDNTGSCQSFKDTTHTFPRFYQFGSGPADASHTDNVTNPAFARVDLVATNTYSHTYKSVDWQNAGGPKVTGTETVDRTYEQEMENYANWFAYYRTRIQAVKTVVSLSFLGKDPTTSKFNVDDKFRVGLHTLSNNPTTTFVPVDDFKAAQKTSWATQLFGLSIRMSQETPNLNAMARVGEYYKNGTSVDLGASVDPIVLSCQKNWHMLFTDGLTNQQTLPSFTPPKDQDDTTPTNAEAPWLAGILAQGVDWPAPYREDPSNKIVNSAADYATYYWVNDLRLGMTNNVGVSAADKANWQHVNFAAISLGTEGKLAAGDQSGVESQLAAGALQWTVPYPSVIQPDASGVDDLWHASVNSRGRFVNADSADEIKVGMGAILADIANTAGSRAGAGLQSVNLTGTTANAYRVTFEPGWGGTVSKVVIDTKTLNEIPPAPWQVGGGKDVTAPSDTLYGQLTPTLAKPDPWYTNRNIVTMHTNGTAIPFLFDSLSAAQQDTLAPGKPDRGLQVLEYLRGSAQNEGATTRSFRRRISPLGDIVDASPKFVGPANLPYQEFADPGYSAFKAATKTRLSMVYAAANDGMLHAFADTNGIEKFAYIPRVLFRNSDNAGLAALTLKEGALPPFQHHFYVDSTPKVVDVDFGSQNWHSILVGGLGKGGHAYYALDVTDPGSVVTETDAASKVLWEFTDADLGYTYGPAIVTKTAGWSGKWVVIVPSGYNNASGVGKIWILDAKTGAVLKTMSTGAGSSGSPAGLAQIAGFTQDYHNYMTDEVYGGDQYGNLWRFDMRNSDPSAWTVGLFAKLTDPSGNPQPVTTAPQIEVDIVNGADRWVFVGTGRLLDESDLSDDQIQSFYGLRDGTQKLPSTVVSGSPIIRSDLLPVTDGKGTTGITAHGWVHDLAEHSRIVSPYQAVLSVVVYSATKPQTDPCLTGQSADVFIRNFAQGVSQTDASFSSTGITCTDDSCFSEGGAVDAQIVGSTPDGSTTPDLYVAITLGTTGQVAKIPVKKQSYDYSHRLSWRILSE
ncbi:MAG: PilC/PilY family type IV pilus protein [Betaproteobacteria bacterium]